MHVTTYLTYIYGEKGSLLQGGTLGYFQCFRQGTGLDSQGAVSRVVLLVPARP